MTSMPPPRSTAIDSLKVRAAVYDMLKALGRDVDCADLQDTPDRVERAWREQLAGYEMNAIEILGTTFPLASYDEVVLLKDIPFYSTCEHHLLPFNGVAHVAYVPRDKVVGLSKLARLVEMHGRRLQLQERLTRDVAADLQNVLEPRGVAVIVEAQHLCMCARGVMKAGSSMVTSVMLGCFRDKPEARAEVMTLLGK